MINDNKLCDIYNVFFLIPALVVAASSLRRNHFFHISLGTNVFISDSKEILKAFDDIKPKDAVCDATAAEQITNAG